MFRIDSDGATIDNRFTEGNPALSIPATVVSDEWANHVQEEIVKVIEENDIVLSKANEGQLNEAILEFFLRGGRKESLKQALANNTSNADVTGFLMNKTTSRGKAFIWHIERRTDSGNVQEMGISFAAYDSEDDEWKVSGISVHDDADTYFTIDNGDTDAAQLEYNTGDLVGASYSGQLTISAIFELRQ